jgi:hypothetical protein
MRARPVVHDNIATPEGEFDRYSIGAIEFRQWPNGNFEVKDNDGVWKHVPDAAAEAIMFVIRLVAPKGPRI